MILIVRRADNGYILTVKAPGESAQYIVYDEGESEAQACAMLLRDIADFMGPMTSQYDAERIYVKVEPGDKYDEPEDE